LALGTETSLDTPNWSKESILPSDSLSYVTPRKLGYTVNGCVNIFFLVKSYIFYESFASCDSQNGFLIKYGVVWGMVPVYESILQHIAFGIFSSRERSTHRFLPRMKNKPIKIILKMLFFLMCFPCASTEPWKFHRIRLVSIISVLCFHLNGSYITIKL